MAGVPSGGMSLHFVLAIALLIGVSAFFSSSEIAIFSLESYRLDSLADRPGGDALAGLLEDPHRLLVTLLVGNNFVNVAIAALVTALVVERVGGTAGVAASTLVASTVVLLFGEIVPKSYGVANPERVALRMARPVTVVQTVLYPVVAGFETVTDAINRVTGGGSDIERPYVTREEIAAIVDRAAAAGVLEGGEHVLIDRVFRLTTTAVEDVMVPVGEAVAVDAAATVETATAACARGRVTRAAVRDGPDGPVIGYVDLRDLVGADEAAALRSLSRPALHVTEHREVDEVLAELQASRTELALVYDSEGTLSGVVTVEDVVEELVGKVFGLGGEGPVVPLSPGTATARGSATVADVNRALDTHLPTQADTVAALVASAIDHAPAPGDVVDIRDARLTVRAVADGDIRRVHVEHLEPTGGGKDGD